MKLLSPRALFALVVFSAAPLPVFAGSTSVHTTWLWHLHQPIYWPDRRDSGADHYEAAWDTIQQQNAGRPHPSPEVLTTIFGDADRVNAYQNRPHDTLDSLLGYANAGAQVNYSGALMENVQSLGAAGQLGYARTGIPAISRRAPGRPAAANRAWTWSTSPIITPSRRS